MANICPSYFVIKANEKESCWNALDRLDLQDVYENEEFSQNESSFIYIVCSVSGLDEEDIRDISEEEQCEIEAVVFFEDEVAIFHLRYRDGVEIFNTKIECVAVFTELAEAGAEFSIDDFYYEDAKLLSKLVSLGTDQDQEIPLNESMVKEFIVSLPSYSE